MRYYLVIILILCAARATASTYITEIMYNPQGSDNNNEYIELYSEEELNLSAYFIEDSSSKDTLRPLSIDNASLYTLIVEDGFNYTGINASIYSAGASIGNNLNNNQDIIMLKDPSDTIVDTLTYDSTMGGNDNNKSLCRDPSNNQITECTATPGTDNIINTSNTSNTSNTTSPAPPPDISAVTISEFLPDPDGNDNAPLPNGEWIELYNTGSDTLDLAGLKICDSKNNCITITNNNVIDDTTIQQNSYLVVYTNGVSILNNNGFEEVILHNNQVIDKISYTDSKQDYSWSNIDGIFRITTPTPGQPNNPKPIQEDDTTDAQTTASYFSIDNIYATGNTISFGEPINIRLQGYKGDTNKRTIRLYIDKISGPTTVQVQDKFTDYEFVIPLQLKPNCDNTYPDGNYTLIAEGLDYRTTRGITIQGTAPSLCRAETAQNISTPLTSAFISPQAETLIKDNAPDQLNGEVIYQSKDKQVRTYAGYFFYIAVALILAYFIITHHGSAHRQSNHRDRWNPERTRRERTRHGPRKTQGA